MVINNSSLLTATKPITTTGGKNNSVELLLYPSTNKHEEMNINPTICNDDDQQIENEPVNTDIQGLSNDNGSGSDDQKEDMMLVNCDNTVINDNDSDDRDENNCCDDDSNESKNDELTLEQIIQRAKVTLGGGALVILGICLTPIPILPLGIPTIGIGLHVLGSEYEEAKNAEQKLLEGVTWGKAKLFEEYDKHHCQIESLMEERRGELTQQGVLIQQVITKSKEQLTSLDNSKIVTFY